MRAVDGNIERTVERVGVDVLQEDGVVALCQQGHGSCNEDRHLTTNSVVDGADENLRFPSTGAFPRLREISPKWQCFE